VLTYSFAKQQPQSIVLQAESGREVYDILSGLQPNYLAGDCGLFRWILALLSSVVFSETLPNWDEVIGAK